MSWSVPSLPRRRVPPRVMAVAVLAAGAFAGGVVIGAGRDSPERSVGTRFVSAWQRGDYAAMYDQLSDEARRATTLADFTSAYRRAAATATMTGLRAGPVTGPDNSGRLETDVVVRTHVFGPIRFRMRLPLSGSDTAARIAWTPSLTFPGREPGEGLERDSTMAPRASILARDGTPLAEGEGRTSPLGPVASAVTGQLGPPPAQEVPRLHALGFPATAQVGISGLERVFESRLAGRPGGILRAGNRVLASAAARPAPPLRTSIDPEVQRAAVQALGARLGGIAALRPRTGEILALAGIAFSGLQPPGSTFKIITLSAALDAGIANLETTFPFASSTTIEGVELANAHHEYCGGTLRNSFAQSCNSVFAPLGVRIGAERLVRTAEAFGFNAPLGIPGAATSTIPPAGEIGDALAVGSSAIGQGRVQATALQMAWVASTIAGRGRRPVLTLQLGRPQPRRRVLSADVARKVGRAMIAVVTDGTGRPAAIPGVRIAGKTGTAELRNTTPQCTTPVPTTTVAPTTTTTPSTCPEEKDDPTDTDAWFAAYAPAGEPRIAVGVLLVSAGAGADTAAPAARIVLQAALARQAP